MVAFSLQSKCVAGGEDLVPRQLRPGRRSCPERSPPHEPPLSGQSGVARHPSHAKTFTGGACKWHNLAENVGKPSTISQMTAVIASSGNSVSSKSTLAAAVSGIPARWQRQAGPSCHRSLCRRPLNVGNPNSNMRGSATLSKDCNARSFMDS